MHICLVVLLISGVASAHSGDRVYPFHELTDETLEKIDIHDGLIDEWYEIGEPSMTMLDFKTFGDSVPLDPSNLDARIWLAWHDESNRIYAALVVADDKYYNAHNHNAESPPQQHMDIYDSAAFYIDGDMDQTGFSELSANQIVGFAIVITDQDRRFCDDDLCISKDWYPADIELDVPEPWGVFLAAADLFLDGLLLPALGTAVESITWGRIKASLRQ